MPTMDIHLHLVGLYLPAAGGQPHTTTTYHPQSKSMVERVHRHLQEGLKARGGGSRQAAKPALGPPQHQDHPQV
jgi:hypothetical protein